jgi:uncharacterized protein YqeY
MSLKKNLEAALMMAMKNQNDLQKKVLRMAISSIKLAEVEAGKQLEDPVILNILQKEVRTREETINEAEKANRSDMIPPLRLEIEYLRTFLPPELSDEELKMLIQKISGEMGISTVKEMGILMKSVIQAVEGKATNERISIFVRELLTV